MKLSEGQPDVGGPYAEEGTALHELAARMLRGDPIPPNHGLDVEVVEPYVRDVQSVAAGRPVHVEKTLGGLGIFGTPDAWVVDLVGGELIVWDLKTGWSLVEVFENWQLLSYVLLILDQHLLRPSMITLRIVQPRPYHPDGPVRSWRLSCADLEPYRKRIVEALDAIRGDRAHLRVSDACRYCPARAICPALRNETLADVDKSHREPVDLPNGVIASELRELRAARQRLDLRIVALEERILARLQASEVVPGAALQRGRGRRVWVDGAERVVEMLSGKSIERPAYLTPEQAIAAGVPAGTVLALSKRNPGKTTITTDIMSAAKQAFGKKEST